MEKLLIIGAGIGQVPLLKKAQAKGIHVTVASIPGSYPCFEMTDDVIYQNIYDRDIIVEEARKRGVTAVISDQNDLMMPTVAYVAEKLGLPGNAFDTVMTYCNKNHFRDLCDKAGVPCPKHIAVDDSNVDAVTFHCPLPWIVKPADSQSSIGIKKINHGEELKPALETALRKSPTHTAIIEEFFEGRELVCEGFINEGKYYLLSFADRRYFHLQDVLIPSQTLFPSTISKDVQNVIVGYEQALARKSNPSFAIVHSEYLVNETTGEIRIVESALRGGGVYISSDLIPMATGIDINDVLLSRTLGQKVDVETIFKKCIEHAAAYVCFYLPQGKISAIEGMEKIKSFPFVKAIYIDDIKIGNVTEPPSYKGARKGPILLSACNRTELDACIRKVQETFKVEVMTSFKKIENIHWE